MKSRGGSSLQTSGACVGKQETGLAEIGVQATLPQATSPFIGLLARLKESALTRIHSWSPGCAVVAEIYFLDWQRVQRSSQASQSAIAGDKVKVK